jgi:hypothetical protein
MSEPTYRIEVKHRPMDQRFPWQAAAYRVTDGSYVDESAAIGKTSVEALWKVQEKLALAVAPEPEQTFYVDEDGELTDAPEPQSLRA